MTVTSFAAVFDFSGKVVGYKLVNISGATSDYLYSIGLKYIFGPLAHTSSK